MEKNLSINMPQLMTAECIFGPTSEEEKMEGLLQFSV